VFLSRLPSIAQGGGSDGIQAVAAFVAIRDSMSKEFQIHPDAVKNNVDTNDKKQQPLQPRE